MGRSNLDLLVKQHFYKHVLDITGERIFRGRKIDFKNSTYNFYYVLSLYMFGRFDESLEHRLECIEKYEGCEKDIGIFMTCYPIVTFEKVITIDIFLTNYFKRYQINGI